MPRLLAAGCLVLAASPGSALIEGRVENSRGVPVEHARVTVVDGSGFAFSDARGRFRLAEVEPPAELLVSHPRFIERQIAVTSSASLTVVLEPKQEVFEEIAVSANRGESNFSPVSVASSVVEPAAGAPGQDSLLSLIDGVAGVAENGQGGLFQTYSVRGVARQRVLTLLAGARIVGERRAGVATSFLDPLLMERVEVLRGPSSTYYGSGALGGVVQVFPRRFRGTSFAGGYESRGDLEYQALGWGDENWSAGLARRRARSAETPGGEELNSGFSQVSAVASRGWRLGESEQELVVLGSRGRDIGKASTDFPERETTYPREQHLLVRWSLASPRAGNLEAYLHPNRVETRVVEADGRSELDNDALDFGLNWRRELVMGQGIDGRIGVDWFGRRSVDAVELAFGPGAREVVARSTTLDGAEEDEAGIYGVLEWTWGEALLLAGGRFAWQRQANTGLSSREDTAVTGFAGMVLPLGSGFELVANLGSGLRFPSLSERFFSGVTGRGEVQANPDLEPERSLNLDAGVRWYGQRLFMSAYLFRNEIDDYIERIEIAPDELTFRNLTSGTIEGLELEGLFQPGESWSLGFGGHLMEGRDVQEQPLADVPADRVHLEAELRRGAWQAEGRWEHRAAKGDPGSGEKKIGSAELLSATLSLDLPRGWSVSLSGWNLLDEEYFNSADGKVPLAPGRSLGVGLRWTDGAASELRR